jgi:hypothetical protein
MRVRPFLQYHEGTAPGHMHDGAPMRDEWSPLTERYVDQLTLSVDGGPIRPIYWSSWTQEPYTIDVQTIGSLVSHSTLPIIQVMRA